MKSNWLFYLAVAVNIFTIWLSISNHVLSQPFMQGEFAPPETDLTAASRREPWLISAGLAIVIGIGFLLRAKGKFLAANILVCIPALPMSFAIIICGGLALLFTLFGK